MAAILIMGGVIPLAAALVFQFGFGFNPCHFCLLQRYPYLPVIAAGALLGCLARGGWRGRLLIALAIYGLFATAILGLIHTGIESKFLAYTGGCVAQAPADNSLDALRAAIASAPLVPCDQATATLLGLSMAGWNVIWAVFVIVLVAWQYRLDRRQYVHPQ